MIETDRDRIALNELKRQALAKFLRKHRESVVGLRERENAGRRRTPGLRREEVAQLADISTIWYTRLEQGKEISPSGSALSRIANVLQLTASERVYLFQMAERVDPESARSPDNDIFDEITAKCVNAILVPAYILDKYFSPIVWNERSAKIFELWLAGPERNLLKHVFLDPRTRDFLVDWEVRARQLLAQFRSDFITHADDPVMLELVAELKSKSALFRDAWDDQKVLPREVDERTYVHPIYGKLTYYQNTFVVCANRQRKLVILIPKSDATN
jgi:transcriptional regulator with XRE-family HTH domain